MPWYASHQDLLLEEFEEMHADSFVATGRRVFRGNFGWDVAKDSPRFTRVTRVILDKLGKYINGNLPPHRRRVSMDRLSKEIAFYYKMRSIVESEERAEKERWGLHNGR